MNQREYLFTCLTEECCEVGQIVSKIKRFGLTDVNVLEPDGPNNLQRLKAELNDIMAVVDFLVQDGALPPDWQDSYAQNQKQFKLLKFMKYSKANGRGSLVVTGSEPKLTPLDLFTAKHDNRTQNPT